uniref:Peptidase S1 domain-containing protein n=1 Tax=Stegastes partitus TaxID=144197 RepID=A0A3B4ZQ31_9TELE
GLCFAKCIHVLLRVNQHVFIYFPALRLASLGSRRMPGQAMVYLGEAVVDGAYAGGAPISDAWKKPFVSKSQQDIERKLPVLPKVRSCRYQNCRIHLLQVVLHPQFQNRSDWDDDVALLQLKASVVMSDKITPIPLPERGHDLTNPGYGVYMKISSYVPWIHSVVRGGRGSHVHDVLMAAAWERKPVNRSKRSTINAAMMITA